MRRQYNLNEMDTRLPSLDPVTRLVRMSPVEDAFVRKMAHVVDLVLAADPNDVPRDVLRAAHDARALFSETRT